MGILALINLVALFLLWCSKHEALERLHGEYRGRIGQARRWAAVRWQDDPKTAAEVDILLAGLPVPIEGEKDEEKEKKKEKA